MNHQEVERGLSLNPEEYLLVETEYYSLCQRTQCGSVKYLTRFPSGKGRYKLDSLYNITGFGINSSYICTNEGPKYYSTSGPR